MSQEQWSAVDHYFDQRLTGQDAALENALKHSTEAGLRSINVAPNQGKLLHLLAKIRGARRILEIGTLGGYSTIWLARALPADGKLISLELEPHNAEVARKNIAEAGQGDKVEIVVGQAANSLQNLIASQAEPFDFIFIDADKESNPVYLSLSLQLSRPGTVIIGDNVVRRGRITRQGDTGADVLGLHAFFDLLASTPSLTSTAVQTVGSKGWDGFSITLVEG